MIKHRSFSAWCAGAVVSGVMVCLALPSFAADSLPPLISVMKKVEENKREEEENPGKDSAEILGIDISKAPLIGDIVKEDTEKNGAVVEEGEEGAVKEVSGEGAAAAEEGEGASGKTLEERLVPVKRPKMNYRKQVVSPYVYRKEYSRENAHLPTPIYKDEEISILFSAIVEGNTPVIRSLIKKYDGTEMYDGEGNTPLIYAAMSGKIQSLRAILGFYPNLDARNRFGITALYAVTVMGDLERALLLLERGANPDVAESTQGKTPLMVAIEQNNVTLATALMDYNAMIYKRQKQGKTVMHIAAEQGNKTMVNLLIYRGAYVDSRDFLGNTPLMLAASRGDAPLVSLLLQAGAQTGLKNRDGKTAEEIAGIRGFDKVAAQIASESIRRDIAGSELAMLRRNTRYQQPAAPQSAAPVLEQKEPGIPIPVLKPALSMSRGEKEKATPVSVLEIPKGAASSLVN